MTVADDLGLGGDLDGVCNCPTRRAARVAASSPGAGPFGTPVSMGTSLAAASSGERSRSPAAISQGSTPDLASAESMVRCIPLASFAIGANRKSFRSDRRGSVMTLACDFGWRRVVGARRDVEKWRLAHQFRTMLEAAVSSGSEITPS